MRISEVAKLTGLSVSNIRFYEKKGLLAPDREEENKYRDYSERDVEQLKRIILYRKMNLPIETIYLLMNGEASLENVLKRQEEELTAQREMLQGSINLCRKIREEPDPQKIDVDYYLNYVYKEEDEGRKFAEVDEFLEDWADFLHISQGMYPLMGNFHVGRLVQNLWVRRGISVVFLILCIGLPLVTVWDQYHQPGQTSLFPVPVTVIFWIAWSVGLLYAFLRFRKILRGQKRENGMKQERDASDTRR